MIGKHKDKRSSSDTVLQMGSVLGWEERKFLEKGVGGPLRKERAEKGGGGTNPISVESPCSQDSSESLVAPKGMARQPV